MNDLVTPFFLVFLQEAVPVSAWQDLENYDVASLKKEQRDIIEADSFWCLSKFLDGIQDNYIFAQLGIQHKVNQLKELIQRIDGTCLRMYCCLVLLASVHLCNLLVCSSVASTSS